MARTTQVRRVVGNPGAKKKYRSNVGDIVGFTLATAGNPGRKRAGMAKAKKATKHSSGYHASKYKKSKSRGNPGHKGTAHKSRYHKRRNPGAFGSGLGPVVTNAAFVIVGALGSKLGAQAVLGTKNTGILGYAGNAGVGLALWFLTEKVMKNRAASSGVIAGTVVQILLRVINDYTPFGQYVAQLGMGDYQMQSFVTPQILVDPMNNADVAIPAGWGAPPMAMLPAAAPAAAGGGGGGAGMAGYGGGGGGALYGASSLY